MITQESQKKLNEDMLQAVKNNDEVTLEKMLQAGADIHYEQDEAILNASMLKYLPTMEILIKYHANCRARNNAIVSLACIGGPLKMVQLLFNNGTDLKSDNYDTILKAAHHGNIDILQYIFDENPDDLKMLQDYSITCACRNNQIKVVEYIEKHTLVNSKIILENLLIAFNFSYEIWEKMYDKYKPEPQIILDNNLDRIGWCGQLDVLKKLLEKGAILSQNQLNECLKNTCTVKNNNLNHEHHLELGKFIISKGANYKKFLKNTKREEILPIFYDFFQSLKDRDTLQKQINPSSNIIRKFKDFLNGKKQNKIIKL